MHHSVALSDQRDLIRGMVLALIIILNLLFSFSNLVASGLKKLLCFVMQLYVLFRLLAVTRSSPSPLLQIEANLGISMDSYSTPPLPEFMPPMFLIAPWVFKVWSPSPCETFPCHTPHVLSPPPPSFPNPSPRRVPSPPATPRVGCWPTRYSVT